MLRAMLRGASAGLIATGPMTAAMLLMHRLLPPREQYPLAPRLITETLTKKAGIRDALDPAALRDLTLINHFGYGAAAGAVYGVLESHLPWAPPLRGSAFGVGVWCVSYLGLLPVLGLLRPATRHPAERTVLMIVAHVIWGGILGVLTRCVPPQTREDPYRRHSLRCDTAPADG